MKRECQSETTTGDSFSISTLVFIFVRVVYLEFDWDSLLFGFKLVSYSFVILLSYHFKFLFAFKFLIVYHFFLVSLVILVNPESKLKNCFIESEHCIPRYSISQEQKFLHGH